MTDPKYGSDEMSPAVKARMDELHDAPVAGENHHHTDANPAVISATEARGGDPNKVGFNIYAISTALVVIVMLAVFLIFFR